MKKIISNFFVCIGLSLGLGVCLIGKGSAGPIIVGNGSGLSEFNILYWQRQLSYYLAQCRAQAKCQKTITSTDWPAIEAASLWINRARIQFEDETTLGQMDFIVDQELGLFRLNRKSLWMKSPIGELFGMSLENASDFLWIGLESQFFLGIQGASDFRNEFKKIIQNRVGEYSITLADGRRLATVSADNAVAGFAILDTDEKAEALLFSHLVDFGECQADDRTLFPSSAMQLQNLDFAFFVGRLGTEPGSTASSIVDLVFNGVVTYDCSNGGMTWSEKANARLTIRLSQMKTAYDFVPSATRVRFDSIERL
jgi:hypothetical protein